MENDNKYNPYKDSTLNQTASDPATPSDIGREAFNDVLKHADIINGHQIPKELGQYPRGFRRFLRWGIVLYVGTFLAVVIYSIIKWL
jgi:hypothetical protein